MFPWIFGFHWAPGYLIFLGAFYCALAVIGVTLIRSLLRVRSAVREGKEEAIRWRQDFFDLPVEERRCRHELAGDVKQRCCPNAFDCRGCADHPRVLSASVAARTTAERVEWDRAADRGETPVVAGVPLPLDRFYHRGHTWVRSEPDGMCTVGLDPLAERLVGEADRVSLPEPGSRLTTNGTAWRMSKGGADVRVLAPIDGTVEETGGAGRGWYLRLRPAGVNFRHLVRGWEAVAWMTAEVERLQGLLGDPALGTTLADGGTLVDDLPRAKPEANWHDVYSSMFLQP